jgi:geranylgeranyl pyrophosphate synthase
MTAAAQRVEHYLEQYLDSRPCPPSLREAVRYSALAPGKRLRPVLVIHSCQAVGGEADQALAPAAAIELIHAFSLVHDDLPAMDDDDLRRGRPTLHRHASEAMAILAGDAMLATSVELVLSQVHPAERARDIAAELVAGTNDMIAGQVYDTLPDFDEGLSAEQRLTTIHRHKTGALIRAACRMGAIVGGAGNDALHALTHYAEAIGLMFQIVDDLLDVTQTTEQLGKTAGKDEAQHKLTYPSVYGVDASRREVERLQHTAERALAALDADRTQPLHQLSQVLATRDR